MAHNIASIQLYYQTEREAPGNPGWAYNVITRDNEHTSGGFSVTTADTGGECLADVLDAFGTDWPSLPTYALGRWEPMPEGGWSARNLAK